MTGRENILTALRRQKPERIPFGLDFCRSQLEEFKKRTGATDFMEYFDMDFRYVDLAPSKHPVDYSRYYPNKPDDVYVNEWGVGQKPGSVAHFFKMIHPMADFTTPQEVWDFPVPDIEADYRYEHLPGAVKKIQDAGYAVVYFAVQLFEPAWYWRGMDNFLADMIADEEMTEALMEKMTALMETLCRKVAEAGVDIIVYGDDVGTQRGLMMQMEHWRKWVKPYTKRVIDAAKKAKPDILAYYHSDGAIQETIPELIEIGVDILNPVQPECMDPAEIKKLYGDKLAFWGTIGTQTTMPFGTPEDVRDAVIKNIETVGYDGGLVIAPTHILEPEVPWENIMAFVDTVKNYKEQSNSRCFRADG